MSAVQKLFSRRDLSEVLNLPSRLDAGTVDEFVSQLMEKIANGNFSVILNAGALHTLTASGMHGLLRAARAVQQVKGHIMLCRLADQPRSMIEACGYDRMIPVFDDELDAETALAA